MELSRRQFLAAFPLLASLAVAGTPFVSKALDVTGRQLVSGVGASVCVLDLEKGTSVNVPIGFKPHSFIKHPTNPAHIWAIERWDYEKAEGITDAYSIAEIDLVAGKAVRQMKVPEGSGYFGHAFFTPDSKTMFVSRVDIDAGIGHITGYDLENWQVVADHTIRPGAVHECRLMPNGNVLAACSGVRPIKGKSHLEGKRVTDGALVQLELATGKILDEKIVQHDSQVVGHCQMTKDGGFLLLSRPRPNVPENGRIYFSAGGTEPLRVIHMLGEVPPKGMGECLSLAQDDTDGIGMVTNPGNEMVFFIDLKAGKMLKEVRCEAKGVVYDASSGRFITTDKHISMFDSAMNPLPPLPESYFKSCKGPFDSPHSMLI